jgi:hypothetical protein
LTKHAQDKTEELTETTRNRTQAFRTDHEGVNTFMLQVKVA